MKRTLVSLLTAATLLTLGGCLGGCAYELASMSRGERQESLGAAGGDADAEAARLVPSGQESPHLAVVAPRKVIYSAELGIVTADVPHAVAETKKLAERLGGYMQRMTRTAIEIRVPAAKFDQALTALAKLGAVTERNVQAADVTEEYVDLEIRLKNSQALLGKLLALLEKAKDVKEALAVEKELSRVRTTIERLEGKLNVLKSRIAYSTITANFMPMQDAPEALKVSLPFWWLKGLGLEQLLAPVYGGGGGGGLF